LATCRLTAFAGLYLLLAWPMASQAQLAGHNTRGDYGLLSGTQAPVGLYGVGMFYDYSAGTLRDRNGDSFPARSNSGSVDVQAAVAGLLWTTEIKLLGGNYGFAIYPAVTNNAVELPALQTDTKTSTGLADTYIQPLILGWITKRADFMAGLGVYAPTGRYNPDADDNRGLGMWSYEVFAGTTVYFDAARTWHFAATAFYETHGKKEDTDIRVGDILTIEGGFGKSFMDGAASAGLAYYAQWKVSKDDFGVTRHRPGTHVTPGKQVKIVRFCESALLLGNRGKKYVGGRDLLADAQLSDTEHFFAITLRRDVTSSFREPFRVCPELPSFPSAQSQ
jgi:hypothetical protein